jgi:hypothetical protein
VGTGTAAVGWQNARLHSRSLLAKPSFAGVSPLVGAALSVAGVVLLSRGTHRASQVQWECFAGRCGTDDFTGAAPKFGLLALALGAILLSGALRTVAAPLATLAASGAVLVGLRGAVTDHLVTSDSVRGWTIATSVLCALSLVLTTIAGVRELRKSSAYWVLLGRASAWGRVRDYEDIDGRRCYGAVHFDDMAGNRYAVRTHVPREGSSVHLGSTTTVRALPTPTSCGSECPANP